MADNTTLNTGAGGDVIASDDIGSVKFQRIKLIHGIDGVNDGDVASGNPLPVVTNFKNPVYRMFVPAGAAAASKVYFDLFNGVGSGKLLKVKSVRAIKDGSVGVTGIVSVKLFLTKTSAIGTGGTAATLDGSSLTAMTISEHDSNNAALNANITARLAPAGGATAAAVICERHVQPEESFAATYDPVEFLMPQVLDVQPLILREGEGLRVVQGTVASVGNIGFDVMFETQ